jgi:hypothetical protein
MARLGVVSGEIQGYVSEDAWAMGCRNSGGVEVVADGKKAAEDASLHHRKEVGCSR